MSWSIRRIVGSTPVSTTAPAESIAARDRLLPTGRLEAFSDALFAIAITLLVLELHVPTGQEALVKGLGHEWPRYLGYFVSFAFIGGVWIAHSNMTRFLKAADPGLMHLNLVLLLFVSFLPFTTAIVATHLFAANFSFHELTVASSAERVAAVLFGLNLTLAVLMLYRMLRHAGRTSDVAADDVAEEELQAFATQRRSAVLLQASATVVGVFLPLLAVIFPHARTNTGRFVCRCHAGVRTSQYRGPSPQRPPLAADTGLTESRMPGNWHVRFSTTPTEYPV